MGNGDVELAKGVTQFAGTYCMMQPDMHMVWCMLKIWCVADSGDGAAELAMRQADATTVSPIIRVSVHDGALQHGVSQGHSADV